MKRALLSILIVALLTFTYFTNSFHIVAEKNFRNFDECDEINVTARLALSEKYGLFSQSMFNGWFYDSSENSNIHNRYIEQRNIYYGNKDGKVENYISYMSQPAGQSFLFGILKKVLPLSNKKKLEIFQFLNCLLLSIFFTIILNWVLENFGRVSALICFLFLILSPILTLMAKSLWWSLWSFYVPFVTSLLLFQSGYSKNNINIFLIMSVSIFIKIWLTGFEFIAPTVLMCFVPVFYYNVLYDKGFKQLVSNLIVISSSIFSSVIAGLMFLILQIYYLTGSLKSGFKHIEFSLMKRTHGDASKLDEIYSESLNSSTIDVITYYINKPVFTLNVEKYFNKFYIATKNISIFDFVYYWRFKFAFLFNVTYLHLTIIAFIVGAYLLLFKKSKKYTALLSILFVSLICSLSWFVIFKAHSVIHIWLDEIVLYFPFFIVCSIYFGILFHLFINFSINKYRQVISLFNKRVLHKNAS